MDLTRAADFHRCCDNKGETVCVIHSTDGYLFGGYTDIPWTSFGYWKVSTKPFLFALRSFSQGNKAVKASIVNSSNAVYHDSFHCCTFGGGPNIYIAESSNMNTNSCSNWYNGQHYNFPPGGLLASVPFKHWTLKCLDISSRRLVCQIYF